MKTERRHTLQTNMLADWLGKKYEQIKPYTNWLLGGALAIVVIAFIRTNVRSYSSSSEDGAWQEFTQSISPRDRGNRLFQASQDTFEQLQKVGESLQREKDPSKKLALEKEREKLNEELQAAAEKVARETRQDLERIAKEFPNSPVGWSSLLRLANDDLARGSEMLLDLAKSSPPKDASYKAAQEHLRLAIEQYDQVKQKARGGEFRMLRQQAQLGLARAYEARNHRDDQIAENDDLKRAEREYKELVDQGAWCADYAQRRLAVLNDKDNQFHEWWREVIATRSLEKPPSKTAGTDRSPLGNGTAKIP
jgi:hypothetical protein